MPFSAPAGWAVRLLLDLCMSMIRSKYECVCQVCGRGLGACVWHLCMWLVILWWALPVD